MAQAITGKLAITYTVYESFVYGAVPSSGFPATNSIAPSQTYSTGISSTGSAIDLHFEKSNTPVTLAASASITYTLSSLTDDLGRNFSMAGGVHILVIAVTSRTAGDHLTLTPGATHGWTALVSGTSPVIKIWDLFAVSVAQTDGYAISAGSNDQFTITNAGSNSITFNIGIAGCDS
jgi:hypothetical protein